MTGDPVSDGHASGGWKWSDGDYGRIVSRYDERKERIVNYWEKRSDSFLEQRRAELHSTMANRWMNEIQAQLPKNNKKLRILDVDVEQDFFTILLARLVIR